MPISSKTVRHPKFGLYEQIIGDTPLEAGHQDLKGPKGEWLGWVMPGEHATDLFVSATKDKVVFELGSGSGERVIRPCLELGAKRIYAVEIFREHLDLVERIAAERGKQSIVLTKLVESSWWNRPLNERPSVKNVLNVEHDEIEKIPNDSSVDLMIARQVVQFGSTHSFHCFLDLAAAALKVGGQVWGINMSPFLQYIYDCKVDLDGAVGVKPGARLHQIIQRNQQFLRGDRNFPGGYCRIDVCLQDRLPDNVLSDNPFLYFDNDTFHGLYDQWSKTRKARGLAVDLAIKDIFLFSPRRIWKANKLIDQDKWIEKENHVFVLEKI